MTCRRRTSSTSGKFDENTMAFPPGVTIKDFQSEVSQGFPNPKPGGQPATVSDHHSDRAGRRQIGWLVTCWGAAAT